MRKLSLTTVLALFTASQAWAFPIEVADAPTNNLALVLSAIHSAKKSLLVNMYEFTDSDIADAILERVKAGIHVEILQEGSPVGGISTAAKGIQSQIIAAMKRAGKSDRYFEMKKQGTQKRRFRYDHAKYMVVDGTSLYITSENFSPAGHPQPGSTGNRGWDAFIHEPVIAKDFAAIFGTDTDTSSGDILALLSKGSTTAASCLMPSFLCSLSDLDLFSGLAAGDDEGQEMAQEGQPTERELDLSGIRSIEASAAKKITSPNTSLSGLVALIKNARTSIDLEQMNFVQDWKTAGTTSPLFDAIVAAAKRGVKIRALLNDESAFGGGSGKTSLNQEAVDALNQLARSRSTGKKRLPIQAKIADLKAMKVAIIHNKGVLIDGNQVLISSINWNENSVTNNRETAVLLTSPAANSYFTPLFEHDWNVSRPAKASFEASLADEEPVADNPSTEQ